MEKIKNPAYTKHRGIKPVEKLKSQSLENSLESTTKSDDKICDNILCNNKIKQGYSEGSHKGIYCSKDCYDSVVNDF
jgi:hypothetical protein